ncbi:TPA: phage tail protein [Escherichia coli]|uniref:prophage tail fiber N-terminal domain-containing protein n=1 Tax=Escherichia coli TaxID=562 RepID=UPI000B42CE46|nr:prophage tail fiber N-terminal domain-containing protein [Escherichia coli]EEZ6324947.1 phage tail protein [Escherichia coli]OWE02417.1 phage tail protein [Escherichia coli]RCO81105.1 phage tail protein [Escherichia coli]HAH2686539.1 phage tail protein [Escherichia coli]HAI0779971.1 phage tail protein [Escherichia coli]
MSVVISGALIDGAGIPMSGCHIILKSRVNTSEVVMRTVADVVTGNCGEYCFKAQTGKYCVYLKQDWRDEYCVGDIAVYDDSKPGTLNDFLTALDEGDLKPDVVKRFEEMVAQAQQSAESAAESERQAGQHVADAQQIKSDCKTFADNVQQNAEAVAEDKKQVALLASSATQDAARAEQAVKDADAIVQKAVDKLADAATLTGEAKASAEAAAKSEQNAKSHADNAAGSAQQTAQDVTATETARDDAERFANEAENSAQTSGTARDESVDAAERASQHKEAASSAATSAENAANVALGHENNAAEYARQAKASQDASEGNAQEAKRCRDEAQQIVDDLKGSNATTTEKGLVQLCSDTDNDSEELAATPKAVKVVMDETNTKAPLDSPAFTGTPTTPTPPDDATGLEMANAAFVRRLLAALVDSSPEALDTLNELAAALGNDPNFATTVTKALAGKQPLNDVLTAVSQIIPEENTLPYFSAEGRILLAQLSEKARALLALDTPEAMRTELELKAAGTMDPQSDIRDRTPGRLALPGAFGFGYAFSQSERLDFNSDEKFLEWVKNATEGRYFIYSYNSKIFPDRNSFTGIVDVNLFPSGSSNGNPAKTDKGLFFYSRYQPDSEQSVFYVQYSSVYADGVVTWGLTSVRNLSLTSKMLSEYLSSTAGAGTYFQYPGIGVPVLAVYRGTAAGDNEIRIGLGDVVHGSCLGSVNITCLIGATGVYSSTPRVGASAYSFPGRYMAISGDRGSYGDEGHICLFVRIE